MSRMELETQVKVAIYAHFAETGEAPLLEEIARRVGADAARVRGAYGRLREERVLVLEPDGSSIRMAPPFSGVPTQHTVGAGGREYFANCAWDALGVPAALHLPAEVRSRCEQSGEPLLLPVALDGPAASDWLFHCAVPAARWWDDIVFT
jgi:alkylmercury lyase-like protein